MIAGGGIKSVDNGHFSGLRQDHHAHGSRASSRTLIGSGIRAEIARIISPPIKLL